MNPAGQDLPRSLHYGSLLVFLSALVPFVVSCILFVAYLISEANPSRPWLAGQLPPGPASFSLNDIRAFQPQLATAFVTAQHIELVNLMNTAFAIMVLAIFGLRRYQVWAWYALLATFAWVGVNDAFALISAHEPPIPLIPETLGIVGLFIARSAVMGAGATAINRPPPAITQR